MDALYQQIIAHMLTSGERLRQRAGNIADIGITKKDLTEEDLRIERELKGIVNAFDPQQAFYAEEEHQCFPDVDDIWVVDPISGTRAFIHGLPHYAIVAAHLRHQTVQFGAVYDPAIDELYTAYRGKGAYLNQGRLSRQNVETTKSRVILNLSSEWEDESAIPRTFHTLQDCDLYRFSGSHAVSDCMVARGQFDGVLCLAKDSFPYFATSLIVQEAGGYYTNRQGASTISPNNRVFIGGDQMTYEKLRLALPHILHTDA